MTDLVTRLLHATVFCNRRNDRLLASIAYFKVYVLRVRILSKFDLARDQ